MRDLEFLTSRSSGGTDLDGLFIVHPDHCNGAPGEPTVKAQESALPAPVAIACFS
jgi:hypothetical protein